MASNLLISHIMRKTLLCSHDPMLIKNLYGLFIDSGFSVEVVDHPSFAIKRIMEGGIELLVIDAATIGLSAKETVEIIGNLVPDLPYILVGKDSNRPSMDGFDIERLKGFLMAIREAEISFQKGVK